MSRWIAPGAWDAVSRRVAKAVVFSVGVLLVVWGSVQIDDLIAAAREGVEITMWSVVLILVPLSIGLAATFHGVVIALTYRAVDAIRAWKGKP